ncbi:MAG: hypothetical protein NWE99_01030 [Candidatus Bathyarchaeota archaeon]|nr:hypothetical protein [Candidatus Bathyarchaeota archaeon]
MEFKLKLAVVAVLALLAGTAFAAPMLVVDVHPFPRIPEGPKANFEIDIVYANFNVIEVNATDREVAYTVVANITNLSDKVGYLYETGFVAAQKVEQIDSALGGMYINKGQNSSLWHRDRGGLVDGIYLDGNWLNKTWIPGTDYPNNLESIINDEYNTKYAGAPSVVPALPKNASETGIWIEGVPIAEYYNGIDLTATHIYINGSWVDVTGRVKPHNPQPLLISSNHIANTMLTPSVSAYAKTVTSIPTMGWTSGNDFYYQYIGGRGFDRAWLPYQSRLIVFNGTLTLASDDYNSNITEALENGVVDLYGLVTSYTKEYQLGDDIIINTAYTATVIRTVTLQKTSEGYLYNAVLAPNQHFQVAQDGVEVHIRQVGE